MSYDEYLDRAMERSPEIDDGDAGRFDLPDPEVRQEGNVTVYENFQSTLDRMDREASHVMKFLQDELGTSANIDERGRLRLTGEFKQSRVLDALERYAGAFVICPECGLPDTLLERERGELVRRCEACGAVSATRA